MTELRNAKADISRFRARIIAAGAVVLLAFGLVAVRLVYLQVVRYQALAGQAESNRTAVVPIVPNRGLILDRNGIPLAVNYRAYTLEITPTRTQDIERMIDRLATLIEIEPRDRRRFQRLLEDSKGFDSLPIKTRLSDDEVARFTAQRFRFPGVDVKARLFRQYPYRELASHVIGYIGRVNQKEQDAMEEWSDEAQANYRGTQFIGKLGVEQSFESELHGTTGVEELETSAGGHAVRLLDSKPATPGQSVVLALDIKLQKLAEDMFGDRRGALVAIDPRSGEVLAFVSMPRFDPNLFVTGIDHESWNALNLSIDKPLLNRALRGTYPPGSTYKPFMAMAALQTGKRAPNTIINDSGSWTFAGHTFRSHGDRGLGPVDMVQSIVKSSNVYYYSLANELGVDAIHDFMKPLGFGQITGIDLKGEARGILPSVEWKRRAYKRPEHQKWYSGETISLGIGQGYNAFTMLQLAQATATLANGGVKHKPQLVIATEEALDRNRVPVPPAPPEDLQYKPQNVALVKRAMVGVTQTGTSARVFAGASYLSGGKTGTAQAVTIGQKSRYDAAKLEERQRDHSLYIAFAPADAPRIALAVVVENAGFGAAHAAPIARRVFDYWLLGQYPNAQDMAAVRAGQAAAPIGQPLRASDLPWPPDAASLGQAPEAVPTRPVAKAVPVPTRIKTKRPLPRPPYPPQPSDRVAQARERNATPR